MFISDNDYRKNLEYVQGLVTLGGLSECGKTAAGNHFRDLGLRKSKIVEIEHDMMRDRGLQPEKGTTPDMYESLYRDDHNAAFKEFLYRLVEKMKAENIQYASLESLYRAPLGVFLKRELGHKLVNIYIDAPLETRAQREWHKLVEKARMHNTEPPSFESVMQRVKEKDAFKAELKAEEVRHIADIIVDNGPCVTKDAFLKKIDAVARTIGAMA